MNSLFMITKTKTPMKYCLLFILLFFSTHNWAQSKYNIVGVVSNSDMARREPGVTVTITSGGSPVSTSVTSNSGKFSTSLDYGKKYKIEFSKAGLLSRFIYVDLVGINVEDVPAGDLSQEMEMSLFGEIPGADLSFLQTMPTTTFTLNMKKMMSEFDRKQADDMKAKIDAVLAKKDALKAAQEDKLRQYEQLMTSGDQNFAGLKYQEALKNYQDASALLPAEALPKDKIAATNAKLKEINDQKNLAAKEAQYNAAIQEADKAFVAKDWVKAETKYEEAINLKPNEQHPTQRLIEIDEILTNIKKAELAAKQKDEQYNNLITAADNLRKQNQFENAKAKYTEAIAIKAEQYPKDQIIAIDLQIKKQAEEAKNNEAYLAAMKAADLLYSQSKLEDALAKYKEATALKPSETAPKEKITEITQKIADLAAKSVKDKSYNDAITAADGLFGQEKLAEAKVQYQKALDIKPDEAYPKTKIAAIELKIKELADKQLADKAYNDKIAAADAKFTSNALDDAKKLYQDALTLKPTEAYPTTKIKEIEAKIADQNKAKLENEKYDKLIADANLLYVGNKLEEAKAKYTEALAIKPAETLPKDKIAEITKKIADLAADKKLEADYTAAITQGQTYLTNNDLVKAKEQYVIAQTLKPTEALPKDKLAEIVAKIAAKEKQDILDKKYNDLVAVADNLFNTAKYADAKVKYLEAKQVKQDPYLDGRIKTIDDKLAEIAIQEAKKKAYSDKIILADNALGRGELENAKKLYEEALVIDVSQTYPKDKIKEIATAIANKQSQAERDQKFSSLVAQADQLSTDKKLEQAVAKYEEAIAVKADQGVQQKITALQAQINLLKGQAQKDAEYQAAINLAQGKENSGDLNAALTAYKTAQSIKPAEALPAQKITEIQNKLQADQQNTAINAQFNQAIKEGDEMFNTGRYQEAKAKYEAAGNIKNDPIVPQKIALAEQKMKEESTAQVEANYQKIINKANDLKSQKDWENAIKYYERALTMKPEDSVPKNAIAEIRKIQQEDLNKNAAQADIEKRYNDAMALGNQKLINNSLSDALNAFVSAQDIKPGDVPAQNKINEVNKLIKDKMSSEQENAKYQKFIQEGDKLALAFNYENAILSYQQALEFKPNDAIATQKIAEAKAQINKRKNADKNLVYNEWIGKANQAFVAENYEASLNLYQEALKIKPDDKVAQDRINEIRQILDNIEAQKNKSKESEAAYKAFIVDADSKFVKEEWKDAQKLYQQALGIKPTDSYAKAQLQATIDKQEAETNKMLEGQYAKILAKGDEYFNKEGWDDAKRMYERAISIKPSDQYPKDKLVEIARIMANGGKKEIRLENLGRQEDISVMDGEALIAKAEITRKSKKNERILKRGETSNEEIVNLSNKNRKRNLKNDQAIDSIMINKALSDVNLSGIQNEIIKKVDSIQSKSANEELINGTYEYNSSLQTQDYVNQVNEDKSVLDQKGQEIPKTIAKDLNTTMVGIENKATNDGSDEYNNAMATKEHLNNVVLDKETADSKSSGIRDAVQTQIEDIQTKEMNKTSTDLEKEYKDVKAANSKITEIETNKDDNAVDQALILQTTNQKVVDLNTQLSENATKEQNNAYQNNTDINNKIVEVNKESEEVASQQDGSRQEIIKKVNEIQDTQSDQNTVQATKQGDKIQEMSKQLVTIANDKELEQTNQTEQHQQVVDVVESVESTQNKYEREKSAENKTSVLTTNQQIENVTISSEKNVGNKGEIAKNNAEKVTIISDDASKLQTEKSEQNIEERRKLNALLDQIDAKGIQFNETIANSLADQFPAGITEQNYPLYDEDGLLLSMMTRRIIVKDGRGDVYVRSTSRAGTTYTKNGTPIAEAIWAKETQDARLEKH